MVGVIKTRSTGEARPGIQYFLYFDMIPPVRGPATVEPELTLMPSTVCCLCHIFFRASVSLTRARWMMGNHSVLAVVQADEPRIWEYIKRK